MLDMPAQPIEFGAQTAAPRDCNRRGHGTGSEVPMHAKRTDPLTRYAVEDRGYRTLCWIWQGKPDGSNGYGRARVGGGQRKPAHVLFYEHHVGPIPAGLQLDHLCCVSLCVNPQHLEPVTGTVNNRRRRWNKLSETDAAEIRAFHADYFREHPLNSKGKPRMRLPQGVVGALAEIYGCSPEAVAPAIKGRTWA